MLEKKAKKDIKTLTKHGFDNLPICVAKTQNSITDNPTWRGAPVGGWDLTVREVYVNAGAGFLVAICGDMMLMPGLPRIPASEHVDIDETGKTIGLF